MDLEGTLFGPLRYLVWTSGVPLLKSAGPTKTIFEARACIIGATATSALRDRTRPLPLKLERYANNKITPTNVGHKFIALQFFTETKVFRGPRKVPSRSPKVPGRSLADLSLFWRAPPLPSFPRSPISSLRIVSSCCWLASLDRVI